MKISDSSHTEQLRFPFEVSFTELVKFSELKQNGKVVSYLPEILHI